MRKQDAKLSQFANDMILYMENFISIHTYTHTHICNLLENTKPIRTNTFSKFAGTKSICKTFVFIYTNSKQFIK